MPDSRPVRPNPLSDTAFDRASHRRTDAQWLEAMRLPPETLVAPIWHGKPLIVEAGETRRAGLISSSEFDWSLAGEVVFLGLSTEKAYFAADVSALNEEAAAASFAAYGQFADLRAAAPVLPDREAALLAYAKGMMWWHERHRFCGVSGHPTRSAEGGHRRICTNEACGAEHFPRSDPAIIVLVEHGHMCLLARNARFPEGFHSILAGFVEPGESLEDAVAREVFEECGVRLTDIEYRSSQPWPFPSSLMLGFRARAADGAINIDSSEIVAAGWYARDYLRELMPDDPFKLPTKLSIARRLIDDWLAEED